MNVSLTPQLEEFTRDKVTEGTYRSASEVIREGLRLLMEREEKFAVLKSEIQKAHQQVLNGETIRVNSRNHFLELVRGSHGS